MAKYKLPSLFLLLSILQITMFGCVVSYPATEDCLIDKDTLNQDMGSISFPRVGIQINNDSDPIILLNLDSMRTGKFGTLNLANAPRPFFAGFQCTLGDVLSGNYRFEWSALEYGDGLIEIPFLRFTTKRADQPAEIIGFSRSSILSRQVFILRELDSPDNEFQMSCYIDKTNAKVQFKIRTNHIPVVQANLFRRKMRIVEGELQNAPYSCQEIEIICIFEELFKVCRSNSEFGIRYGKFIGFSDDEYALQIENTLKGFAKEGLNLAFIPYILQPFCILQRDADHFFIQEIELRDVEKAIPIRRMVVSTTLNEEYCDEAHPNLNEPLENENTDNDAIVSVDELPNGSMEVLPQSKRRTVQSNLSKKVAVDEESFEKRKIEDERKLTVDGKLIHPITEEPFNIGVQKLIIPFSRNASVQLYNSAYDGSFLLYKMKCSIPIQIKNEISKRRLSRDAILGPIDTFVRHFRYQTLPFTFIIDTNGTVFMVVSNDIRHPQLDALAKCKMTPDEIHLEISENVYPNIVPQPTAEIICTFTPLEEGRFQPSCSAIHLQRWVNNPDVHQPKDSNCKGKCTPLYSTYLYDLSYQSVTRIFEGKCTCGRVLV